MNQRTFTTRKLSAKLFATGCAVALGATLAPAANAAPVAQVPVAAVTAVSSPASVNIAAVSRRYYYTHVALPRACRSFWNWYTPSKWRTAKHRYAPFYSALTSSQRRSVLASYWYSYPYMRALPGVSVTLVNRDMAYRCDGA